MTDNFILFAPLGIVLVTMLGLSFKYFLAIKTIVQQKVTLFCSNMVQFSHFQKSLL